MDPDTPACVLSCAFMPNERRVDGRLADLARIAGEVPAPAILVIGKTASMHLESPRMPVKTDTAAEKTAQPAPTEDAVQTAAAEEDRQPAAVLIVGTRSFTEKMAAVLEKDGIHAVQFPCMEVIPQREEIPEEEELRAYDWLVFTSRNGVRVFLEEFTRRRTDIRRVAHMKIACIGKGTAAELEKAHLYADLIPESFTTQDLARELSRKAKANEKILILRAVEGNPILTNKLKNEKILYKDCKIYRTQYCVPETAEKLFSDREEGEPAFDRIIFASAGGVRCFLERNTLNENVRAFCIGALTAAEFARLTGREAVIAGECSAEGIRRSLRES